MSWQAYVDDHLLCDLGEGLRLSSAAILGLDGSVWAQSESFPPIKPEEISAIVNEFNEPGSLAPTGLYLGSTKYMVIQGDAGVVIRGKKIKPEEINAIVNEFNEPGSLAPTGLYLGSTKYMVIQGDAGVVIRGKKGSGGVTVKKTNLALVIGIYEEPVTPGQCNVVVENLGDYLFDQGF